ncbi:Ste5p Ecym_3510 [Eremothecium cymbalariae DBVPG|uniref:Protein Ste5 Fus3-binding domain-containing protein n=1 Tax=Eremothecium cymbalariae (strain CBS 270.75 / DBVPG 7215 / KCTC 17166 / NRRL Y-17582) TaxID=931890 RepID=G8JS69_ERECY|nr:Hypothetical protein Ecym_3510 [Eremothecium cymbalariae DBVPG\
MIARKEISLPVITVGAPPKDLTPPVTPSNKAFPFSNGSSPLSQLTPRSRRRWAERLNLKRKRNTNNSGQSPQASDERSRSIALSSPINEFPKRSTSIPTPPALQYASLTPAVRANNNNESLGFPNMGSRHADDFISPKKSIINEKCCLCDEPVTTRSYAEKIIALQCDHTCHEDCLWVLSEDSESSGSFDTLDSDGIYSIFPACVACEGKLAPNRCIPKDDDVRDRLISTYLIKRTKVSQRMPALDITPTSQHGWAYSSDIPKRPMNISTPLQPPPTFKNQLIQRKASTLSTISSIVSSVPTKNSDSGNDSSVLSLAMLRSYFVQSLLVNFPDWQIDSQFGLLRLVDRFMCTFTSRTKVRSQCICYLFEHRFVVGITDKIPDHTIVGLKFNSVSAYSLSNVKIDTLESSVLTISIGNETVYITEDLGSKSTQVLEKWITAFLNPEMKFQLNIVTSTLSYPSLFTENGSGRHKNTTTLTRGIHGSVIIRRSVFFKYSEHSETPTSLRNCNTRISSILSLKRKIPNDLFIVFQIDPIKLLDGDVNTLVNICKALSWKLETAKLCLVDKDGYLVTSCSLKLAIPKLKGLNSLLAEADRSIKFSPADIYQQIYGAWQRENIGVTIISNSSMETGRSALLMDYSAFCNVGKRRPNELKIKVGYLNADYSDKVYELVETDKWNDVFEVICYSFNMAFGQDALTDEDDDGESFTNFSENNGEQALTPTTESDISTLEHHTIPASNISHILSNEANSLLANMESPVNSSCSQKSQTTSNHLMGPLKTRDSAAWSSLFSDLDTALNESMANVLTPTSPVGDCDSYGYI